jgi:hypothetical protein
MKSFFDELQSLSEATKHKIMIVTTIVLMIGILYVWLEYFNGLVGVSGGSNNQAQQNSSGSVLGGYPGQNTINPSQP